MTDATDLSSVSSDLLLKFDPLTIEHLGSNMYSRLPNAVAELVANAYDADATEISVKVLGSGEEQQIVVEDNGHGMSRNDVRNKYLRIGRNRRRTEATDRSESGRRAVSGKKGLGKLALFGIGHRIVVSTTRVNSADRLVVTMNWQDLIDTEDGDYQPGAETALAKATDHGTSVTVSRLTRSSDISPAGLAESLSRLFQYNDSEVALSVVGRDGSVYPVTRELRVSSVATEFKWDIPTDLPENSEGLRRLGVIGVVIAAEKPLATQMRGIAVYANGCLVNEPEFFGASDSSYAYAYLTGYIAVDGLDAIKPDVVATDRRAVNWDQVDAAEIRILLRRMVEEVAQLRRQLRADKKKDLIEEETGVDSDQWVDTVIGPEKEPLRDLIGIIESDDTDMSDEDRGKAVKSLKDIAPPYADLVWRHLHPRIQSACEHYFKAGDYHQALVESCKQYVSDLRSAAGLPDDSEANLFGKALGDGHGRLHFTDPFRSGNPAISGESVKNLENGQRELAKAIWTAFRNPLSHEPLTTIKTLGVISHEDCLDALSLMSHLRRRLECSTVS
ncbi:TIGR02391 family protein [Mycobacteroides abscessus]|uniref:TIGR02391 family protein n=1 Tax=Mycobacteroides abscessus TaxID=36809 RepID=UPI00037F8FB2|nr:TIGR02391 family protein [Mycobacteroides abscessus]